MRRSPLGAASGSASGLTLGMRMRSWRSWVTLDMFLIHHGGAEDSEFLVFEAKDLGRRLRSCPP